MSGYSCCLFSSFPRLEMPATTLWVGDLALSVPDTYYNGAFADCTYWRKFMKITPGKLAGLKRVSTGRGIIAAAAE
jgi:hypothetical protein